MAASVALRGEHGWRQVARTACHLVWHAPLRLTLRACAADASRMPRHPSPAPHEPTASTTPDDAPAIAAPEAGDTAPSPSLAGLGIAGISRRRIAWVAVVALAVWIVVAFAGQAAAASQATADVAADRARNAAAAAKTEALRRELALVTQERWVLQQARAYQLGSRKERPVALAPGAPSLAPDAPGSPARRLGADEEAPTPLESWLEVLFGPGPDR